MTPLNPIDAIAPAFTRTHELLFQPFSAGRSWKLAASSYLAFCGSVFFPIPLVFLVIAFLPGIDAAGRSIFLVIGGVYSAFVFTLFYFGARMSLVDFEMIVTRQKFIAPMWRRYGRRVWPWIALKVVVGTILSAAMSPIFIAAGKSFYDFFKSMPFLQKNTPPDPASIAGIYLHMMGFYGLFFLYFIVLKLASTLLDDFVKPFFVLEAISLFAALRRGFQVLVADPLHCILYVLLKYVLAAIGYMMQSIAIQVCFIPIFLLFGGVGFVGWLALHHAGPVGTLIMVVGAILLGLSVLVLIFYLTIGFVGYLVLLLDTYAIYFLGGRYPLLGDLLQPGIDRPFTPPPVFPSEDERGDDDGGPPMPMNPAVA